MQIAYLDEAGDDGYPNFSSPLFVLSGLYLHYLNWQPVYERLLDFRRALKIAHNLPVKWEFHTKDFVLNKKPYRALAIPDDDRSDIIDQFCDLAGNLDIKVVNVAIRKSLISNPKYQVLRTALKFLV